MTPGPLISWRFTSEPIGIGGAATDNWDTIVAEIPAGISGGVQPPSVYNETDAVYGAAILLHKWGAPGSWPAALVAWNDYPPEIAQVTQLVAQYTNPSRGQGDATLVASTAPIPAGEEGCVPVSGPTTPGAVARVLPNGFLLIEGSKNVQINSEWQVVTVRGVVRPADLTADNTVASQRIAQMEVKLDGKGVVNDAIRRPNYLYRLLLGLLPF